MRFLFKNKVFSFINILGLTLGILCCLYIVLYVQDQYNYDKHHRDAADIYRIVTSLKTGSDSASRPAHLMATSSPPIAPAMKKEFPEVSAFTRVIPTLGISDHLLKFQDKALYVQDAVFVDSSFFDVFTYHFSSGRPGNLRSQRKTVVLLKSVSDKLFSATDPTEKQIIMVDNNGTDTLTVAGVVDESLGHSHLSANVFIRMTEGSIGGGFLKNDTWTGNNFAASYVKLHSGADAGKLQAKLPGMLLKYAADEFRNEGMQKTLSLQPVSAIHTGEGFDHEPTKTVSGSFLRLLLGIAGLILITACINFMNLSTARASDRAKEVGVRKTIGAGKGSLRLQFLGEALIVSLTALVFAVPLLFITLPYLNHITGANVSAEVLFSARIWFWLISVVLLTALISGSYPAFYLSAFKAIKVLKGNFSHHGSRAAIRKGLVVFQFTLSITLMICLVVIYSQLKFIRGKDLGFTPAQKLVFSFHTAEAQQHMLPFANDLRSIPGVRNVSKASNYPGPGPYNDWGVFLAGGTEATSVDQQNISTDENFASAIGVQILSGRNFRAGDSAKVLINETLAQRLGLKSDKAPGTTLYTSGDRKYEIAGVIKNINYQSLRENVGPFMLICNPHQDDLSYLIVDAHSGNYQALLTQIGAVWHKRLPAEPFDFSFLDEVIQKQYEKETTLSGIVNAFTGIAIFISCMGLFGLAAFSAEQRRKEISIRKVLGASILNVTTLLSRNFVYMVTLSFAIAVPIAGWAMNDWLGSFSYRVGLKWWMFAVAGLMALFIALLTVAFHAVKTALSNPVNNLRAQ